MNNDYLCLNLERQIFIHLIQFLSKHQILYTLLGNTSGYPKNVTSDIDIAVSSESFELADDFIKTFCADNNYQLCTCLQHELTAKYYVVAAYDTQTKTTIFLAIDICSDYYRNNRLLIPAHELLQNNRLVVKEECSFYVCNNRIGFLYYFIKKAEKLSFSDDQLQYLQQLWNEDDAAITLQLNKVFSDKDVLTIVNVFNNHDYSLLKGEFVMQLKQQLIYKFRSTLIDRIKNALRLFNRVTKPTGLFVAFMGCDGSGKSTIINELLSDRLNNGPFRRKSYFHLFATSAKTKSSVVSNPHAQKKRSALGSNLKILYFLFKYTYSYWLIVFPRKVSSELIIFDRYYHDLLVDPLRYRHGGSKPLAKLIGKLIPKPDLFFFVDAPAEMIFSRKQEVSLSEVERQTKGYRELASWLNRAQLIDNTKLPLEAAFEIEQSIIHFLSDRYKRRS